MIAWLIGMSGSGKTTVGRRVYEQLKSKLPNLVFLDGDILRDVWGDHLGHSVTARKQNSDRITALCRLLDRQGIHAVCCVLSIFPQAQAWNRAHYSQYYEAYLQVSLDELIRRDTKGLYRQALAGEICDVVGVDIEFPQPAHPDRVIVNEGGTTAQQAAEIIESDIGKLLKLQFERQRAG